MYRRSFFDRFAKAISSFSGHPIAFAAAAGMHPVSPSLALLPTALRVQPLPLELVPLVLTAAGMGEVKLSASL